MSRKTILLSLIGLIMSIAAVSQDMNYYWAQQYGHDNYTNNIEAVTSDYQNHIICFTHFNSFFTVNGNQFEAGAGDDLLVFVVNEYGEFQWALSDGGEGDQLAQEVVCDNEGNVYLMGKFSEHLSFAGDTFESNGSYDMYIIKLNASGEKIWVKTFGGPNSESFQSINIHENKINVVGRYYNYTVLQNDTIWGVDGTDFFVAQLDLDGELLNYVTFGGESVDMVSDVAADNLGNIYLTGDFYQSLQIGEETFETGALLGVYVLKLNANLDIVWAYQLDGSDLKPGVKIVCDPYGNMALAGSFSGQVAFENTNLQTADFDEDIYVAYFSADGEFEWAKRFYSSSMEDVTALSMDSFGHVYLSGHYLNHIHFNEVVIQYNLCCGDSEIYLVKLDDAGEVLDANQMTGERSHLKDMFVPEINQVILVGQFSEHFAVGNLELESPNSYNGFLVYYKDDTWLSVDEWTSSTNYIESNISSDYFRLQHLPADIVLNIYNSNGQLIEAIQDPSEHIILGENWENGIYIIQFISPQTEPLGLKVLKL
jgi:hypothetical protein